MRLTWLIGQTELVAKPHHCHGDHVVDVRRPRPLRLDDDQRPGDAQGNAGHQDHESRQCHPPAVCAAQSHGRIHVGFRLFHYIAHEMLLTISRSGPMLAL